MTFIKSIKKGLLCALLSGTLAIPFIAPTPVEAANPTLTLTKTYSSPSNNVTVKAVSNGNIEVPGGNVLKGTASVIVGKNGVYTYTATLDGETITRSIHIEEIKSNVLIVNNPKVSLNVTYKDDLSGISQARFRNELAGAWSAWTKTQTTTKDGTEKFPWTFDATKEGLRTVYVQFQDQAGNITPGEPYDKIIYDITGPTFNTDKQKYYVKESTFKLFATNIADTYSTPTSVSVSVDGAGFVTYPLASNDFSKGVNIAIPVASRTPGEKAVKVKMTDNLGNVSPEKSLAIYYDATAPTGTINLSQRNGSPLKVTETGRVWEDGKYTFFDKVTLSESRDISLNLNLLDAHSGISIKNGGIALIEVIENDIETNEKGLVVKEKELKRVTYRNTPTNGIQKVDWTMDYGLEKRLDIVVQDNAGNRTLVKGTPIYMSALSLVHFRITEVVNPDITWTPVDWNTTSKPAEILAGGNIEFELMYNLMSTNAPTNIYGSVEVKTALAKSGTKPAYEHIDYISLKKEQIKNDKEKPYFTQKFTVPPDAPVGSEMFVQGWLTAEFANGQKLRIHFPTKNASIYQKIGVITGDIQEKIQFNAIR